MVKFAAGAIALGICIATFSSGAGAAERLPAGSYASTCKDIAYAEGKLAATCQMRDGGWAESILDKADQCASVSNQNGDLHCDRWVAWTPTGSFTRTCKDVLYADHALRATCQMRDGGWAETVLPNPDACGRTVQIANENGQLRCDGHMPAGSYLKSCDTTSMKTRDGAIFAACQNRDGAWVQTKLEDAWECNGSISNQNGQLQCDKPQ